MKIVSILDEGPKSNQLVDLLPNLWIFRTKNLALERSHTVSGNVFEWRYSIASRLAYPAFLLLALLAVGFFADSWFISPRTFYTCTPPGRYGANPIYCMVVVLTYLIIRLIFKLQLLGLFTSGLAAVLSFISLFLKALTLIIGRA